MLIIACFVIPCPSIYPLPVAHAARRIITLRDGQIQSDIPIETEFERDLIDAQLRKGCRPFCGSLSRPRPGVNRVSGDIG